MSQDGDRGTIEGTITSVVCVTENGVRTESDDVLRAILTCLGHVRDASAPTCEDLGHYTDFVGLRGDTAAPVGETTPGLIGHFRDPTID